MLPVLHRTLQEYPGKKWYVFVETDTFLFWHSLLEYLGWLDWQPPRYLGAQTTIDDYKTADSGAGLVISSAAMQQVVSMYNNHKKEWTDFADTHQAGDFVLGKAFEEAGVRFLGAFPIFQADPIGSIGYGTNRTWCAPTVSYHHIAPATIRDLFTFQEDSIKKSKASTVRYINYSPELC
jgi:hypothetical protein